MIGARVRKARLEILGLTQRELAIKLNVGETVISRWERDQAVPRPGSLRRLAVLANVPVAWFWEDDAKAAA